MRLPQKSLTRIKKIFFFSYESLERLEAKLERAHFLMFLPIE
jgi:hypothetical protein